MMSQRMIERKRCINIINGVLAEMENAGVESHPLYVIITSMMSAIYSGKSLKELGRVDLGESKALKNLLKV